MSVSPNSNKVVFEVRRSFAAKDLDDREQSFTAGERLRVISLAASGLNAAFKREEDFDNPNKPLFLLVVLEFTEKTVALGVVR